MPNPAAGPAAVRSDEPVMRTLTAKDLDELTARAGPPPEQRRTEYLIAHPEVTCPGAGS